MATAYYRCPECGKQAKVSHGNRRNTDRYVTWLEQQGRLCYDCETQATKKLHAEQSAAATLRAESAGLPALVGSPKQVAWAETLRVARLDSVRVIVAQIAEASDENVARGLLTQELRSAALLAAETYLADLACEVNAKRFIDQRPGGYSVHADDRREIALRIRDGGIVPNRTAVSIAWAEPISEEAR